MDIRELAKISIILTIWALLLFVLLPIACSKEYNSQDAMIELHKYEINTSSKNTGDDYE